MNKMVSPNARLCYIDRIKTLGLFLVILAHVDLPVWLAQIRSFDVPLLVFASAYLARRSYKNVNVLSYYKKRFIRLAVPAWIFTVFFWCAQSFVLPFPQISDIIKSFLFQRDTHMLGMLWVIWVYIVCALLIPVIHKIKYDCSSVLLMVGLLIAFQCLCIFTNLSDNRILYCTIFTIIPYGFMTWLGYYYGDINKKTKIILGSLSVLTFVFSAIVLNNNDKSLLISDYKYPAQIYYLSYALPFIFALFEFLPKFDKYPVSSVTKFISKSSLWIYLWHMLILYVVKMFIEDKSYWWLQYVLIVSISVFIVWLQNKIMDFLIIKTKWKWLNIFKG